jgi:hypothetical protein
MLIVTPDRNTVRSDYTGAFKPEAERLVSILRAPPTKSVCRIDVSYSYARRHKQLMEAVEICEDAVDGGIAFFCHGWSSGIQCGIRTPAELKAFAKLIGQCQAQRGTDYRVALFCCSTADSPVGGDGSFADRLRDALCTEGLIYNEVFAHVTKGHTTRNPYARVFCGEGSSVGSADAQWVVRPPSKGVGSPLWKAWRAALAGTHWKKGHRFSADAMSGDPAGMLFNDRLAADFRFYVPWLSTETLHMLLQKQERPF